MGKKLYVGNLSFNTTEDELRNVFEKHGGVGSVNIITDRETGRSRGFGFVEMDEASGAAFGVVLIMARILRYRPSHDNGLRSR